MPTLLERTRAAMVAFQHPVISFPTTSVIPAIDQGGRYDFLWDFWEGAWTYSAALAEQKRKYPDLYKNTRQVWRQADAIVSLYEQFVYVGGLSTDGLPLPDGSLGAIPIDPQMKEAQAREQIQRACGELWGMWNMTAWMTLRPKFAAILGDLLTELVEDVERGTVTPRIVWPGHVVDIDLDLVGNVKRYALQYWIDIPESYAYGVHTLADRYLFRKEVDGEYFRYYRDGQPDERYGPGGKQENPYGFVPAIWDRFEQVFGARGFSAIEKTLQQVLELNSVLSHALDYQQKGFAAPVGVVGNKAKRADRRQPSPRRDIPEDPEEEAREAAEALDLMPMTEKGAFVTVTMDIGQTTEMLGLVMDSILAENPEARYGQEILGMREITGPGVERALGPIGGRVRRARGNLDPQTVKLHQMTIAMIGWRIQTGAYPAAILASRSARYEQFAPYNLDSYGKGDLDFTIPDRPWIGDSIDERLARLVIIETLQTEYSMRRAGVPDEDIAKILGEREAEKAAMEAAVTGVANPPRKGPPQKQEQAA